MKQGSACWPALVVVAALVAAACGGSDDGADSDDDCSEPTAARDDGGSSGDHARPRPPQKPRPPRHPRRLRHPTTTAVTTTTASDEHWTVSAHDRLRHRPPTVPPSAPPRERPPRSTEAHGQRRGEAGGRRVGQLVAGTEDCACADGSEYFSTGSARLTRHEGRLLPCRAAERASASGELLVHRTREYDVRHRHRTLPS